MFATMREVRRCKLQQQQDGANGEATAGRLPRDWQGGNRECKRLSDQLAGPIGFLASWSSRGPRPPSVVFGVISHEE